MPDMNNIVMEADEDEKKMSLFRNAQKGGDALVVRDQCRFHHFKQQISSCLGPW